jgi:hypothetical protein
MEDMETVMRVAFQHLVVRTIASGRLEDKRAAASFLVDTSSWSAFLAAFETYPAVKCELIAAARRARAEDIAKELTEVEVSGKYWREDYLKVARNRTRFEMCFTPGGPLTGMGRDWYVEHLSPSMTFLKYALQWEGLLTLDVEPGIDRGWYESRFHPTEHRNIFRRIEMGWNGCRSRVHR